MERPLLNIRTAIWIGSITIAPGASEVPLSAPSHHSCGHPPTRGRCPICRAEYKAMKDKERPNATQRGYDSVWQQIRAEHLRLNPNCKRCNATATHVDHIVPHRGQRQLFLNRSNLQSLCTHCHNSWKQSQEKIAAAKSAGQKDPWQ